MSKFVIECPKCHRYAEASGGLFGTGLFAKRTVKCSCGETINIQTEKLSSRKCPHCGNDVVFDQSKGDKAKCPVCHEPINTMAEQDKTVEFSCGQCGIRLRAAKGADKFTCPVCDHVNDVAERAAQEKIKHDGLASIIKYEGDNSTFIWKHPIEDFNYGSQLIVHESQEAVFFRDGMALDLFGPGRYTLETQQLPMLEKLYKLPTDNDGTFHTEVYFINKTVQMGIKWGTPDKVRFIDPLTGTPLDLGASGEMNLAVDDSRKLLIKLVGTMKGISWKTEALPETIMCEKCGQTLYTVNASGNTLICDNCRHTNIIKVSSSFTKSLQASFRPMIASSVKTNLPSVIKANDIDILEIDEKLDLISASLREKIKVGFEEYGLTVPQLYVTSVVLPENDPNFKRIRELHTIVLQTRVIQAEATVKTVEAQSKAQYRTAEEQAAAAIEAARREAEMQRQMTQTEVARREAERKVIGAQAEAQAQRMQGLTEAEIMAAKGYNQKDVLQAEVQEAYAAGIGNMGSGVSIGGGGSMMGDLMGLGVGMAAMGAIAPQIGNMMSGMNPNAVQQPPAPVQPAAEGWTCPSCGKAGISFKFCPDCGAEKPEPKPAGGWTCPKCGTENITSKFCPECVAKKPEEKKGWTCPECGTKDITSKFCPECGAKKPEENKSWICPNCGTKDIKSKFCPECGFKKGE